ncbi:MAG: SURF1 family protein [Gammaproteobacteria bacterium]
MRIGVWQFSPKIWPTVATGLMFPLLVSLGFWQLDRADQKERLRQQFEQRIQSAPVDINHALDQRVKSTEMIWRKVIAAGTYEPRYQFLLDNQVEQAQAGYFVYTPFKLDAGQTGVLVNRGWIAAGARRSFVPDVGLGDAGARLSGVAKPFPGTGLLLGANLEEDLGGGIFRMQQIELSRVEAITNMNLLPYVVRLDKDATGGFRRVWRLPGSGKAKHLGYAFQWFLLAATLLVIYFFVNLKKIEQGPGENDD